MILDNQEASFSLLRVKFGMLAAFTNSLVRNISRDSPKMLCAYFAGKAAAPDAPSEKWPPYNVCSIPFNVKKNENHIKLKEPHKRYVVMIFVHL